ELVEHGFDPQLVTRIRELVRRNHYKRVMPLIAKLSLRTIGHDFLYPRDWEADWAPIRLARERTKPSLRAGVPPASDASAGAPARGSPRSIPRPSESASAIRSRLRLPR